MSGKSGNKKPEIRQIKVKHGNKIKHIPVTRDGLIDMEKFTKLFPGATTLSRDSGSNDFFMDFDEDFIYVDDVDAVYSLVIPEGFSSGTGMNQSKRQQFQEIVKSIRRLPSSKSDLPSRTRKKSTKQKIANKKQKLNESDSEITSSEDTENDRDSNLEKTPEIKEKQCITKKTPEMNPKQSNASNPRVINIHWMHKASSSMVAYQLMGSGIGPTIKSTLDRNINYTIESLKTALVEKYVNDLNKKFFHKAQIDIGMCIERQIVVVSEFVQNQKKVSFWDFCQNNFKRTNGGIHIYLLTISRDELDSEDLEKVDSDLSRYEKPNLSSSQTPSFDELLNLGNEHRFEEFRNNHDQPIRSDPEKTDSYPQSAIETSASSNAKPRGEKIVDTLIARLKERVKSSEYEEGLSDDDLDQQYVPLQDRIAMQDSSGDTFVKSGPTKEKSSNFTNFGSKLPANGSSNLINFNDNSNSRELSTSHGQFSSSSGLRHSAKSLSQSSSAVNISSDHTDSYSNLIHRKSSISHEKDSSTSDLRPPARSSFRSSSTVTKSPDHTDPHSDFIHRKSSISHEKDSSISELRLSARSSSRPPSTAREISEFKIPNLPIHSRAIKISNTQSQKTANENNARGSCQEQNRSMPARMSGNDDGGGNTEDGDDSDEDIYPRDEQHKLLAEKINNSIKLIGASELVISKQVIGSGAQGIVRFGKFRHSVVAVKSINNRTDKTTLREVLFLNRIRHPNIINILAVFDDYLALHIVMEFFESNDLAKILFDKETKKKFAMRDSDRMNIALQIWQGLVYLHLEKTDGKPTPILHRDIKPGNILVNNACVVKICDLGFASCKSLETELKSTRNDRFRGTIFYSAPEIILNKLKQYSTKSDMWAFACTIYELFSGVNVWPDTDSEFDQFHCVYMNLIAKKTPNLECVPPFLREKLSQCFDYNPEGRPEMVDLAGLF